MGYEVVCNVGFNKKEGKITVSSYSNNVFPKRAETWVYGEEDMTLDEKIESIIRSMIRGNLQLNYSAVSPFTRAYALAIEKAATEESMRITELYRDISKVFRYIPDCDGEEEKPTEDSRRRLDMVCKYLKEFLYTAKPKDDPTIRYKMRKSQRILHYSIYGM